MQMTNSKLNDYILYSNKNVENLCRKIINESTNAVLLEMFDDKMLLADHISGGIYLADYNFDARNATLELENFEDVEVTADKDNLKEAVYNYFDEGYDVASIVEAYDENACADSDELEQSITEALASKNTKDLIDYTQLVGINEEVSDLKDMSFFKNYTQHLMESPSSSIKFIDWVNPVRVSLIDEDENRFLAYSAKNKAERLTKKLDLRESFGKAIESLYNEGDASELTDLLSENYSLLSLDDNSMKEFLSMSVINNKELMENRKEILNKIDDVISEDEILSNYKEVFLEAEDEEETEEDKALETDDKDIDALTAALDKALEKITDEKLTKKIEDLKSALEESKSEGTTDVSAVKECVEMLNF